MYTLKIENSKGDTVELTNQEANYQIVKIEGLNPPNATINKTEFANRRWIFI